MGAEHSHIVVASPLSWRTLHYGIHYAATDVAVWPHLAPLAQWFTAHDALALKNKLNQRTITNVLSYHEFVAWLQNGKLVQALHKTAMPERHDIMTPPSPARAVSPPPPLASKLRGMEDKDPMATRMLELYLEHVFLSVKGKGSKLYAMEFLAAFVLVSRAIWNLEEKVRVLMELFHDPALSARHAAASSTTTSFRGKHLAPGSYDKRFRETDLAQLFLCVMRGVAKVTVGVGRVWDHHGLSIATLARQFAATAMSDTLEARKLQATHAAPVSPSKLAKAATSPKQNGVGGSINSSFVPEGISEPEFREFVVAKPVIQRFLALFVAEELRNPFTFSPLSSMCTGVAFPESYRSVMDQQINLYHSLLKNYVTFEGRDAKRVLSATILIQSTWRRRRSRTLLQQHKEEHIQQRHASAATLQSYLRQFQFAKVLEQHADAEREAFNGGLFVAGSGACIPAPKAPVSGSTNSNKPTSTREHPGLSMLTSPLKLIETFKFLNVRICSVAASQTCALALSDNHKALFAWGRCLPCVYQRSSGAWGSQEEDTDENDRNSVCLFQMTPTRLAHRFSDDEQVVQLACGLRHALVLTNSGMVYSWGFNDHGQLGHGSAETLDARTRGKVSYATHFDERDGRESEFLASPTRLLYFQGSVAQHAEPISVQQICCGDYYSMALSCDGDVFTWGEASEGQLGHRDAHPAFQVAFVDLHMLNSAYTFLSQPEPVLALSNDEIVQIGCRKNHSVALTRDGRVFEWGNWGKRCGRDMEHAFVPIEKEYVSGLRLRQVSVGDHHIVAEGSSVWMSLVAPVASSVTPSAGQPETDDINGDTRLQQQQVQEDGFGVTKSSFYLACAAYSCSFDAIETYFAGNSRSWTCTIVEFDVDDLEDEPVAVDAHRPGEVDDQQEAMSASQGKPDPVSVHSVWTKRVQQYTLSVEQVGRFDARIQQLRPLSYRQNVGYSYEKLLNTWLFGHVEDRFVVFPRGKPAGFYVQFLLPFESISPSETEQRVEAEQVEGYVEPAVVEFQVCGSNTAAKTISKRGFAVHAFHPGMEDAKLTKIQRMKKKKASVVTDESSLFLLEFNESCLPSTTSLKGGHSNVDNLWEMDKDGGDEDDSQMDLSCLIVGEMQQRVLAAQESGVLAVLIVLDLFDVEPFELHFNDDSGVYIPVMMVNKYALAVQDAWALESSSPRKRMAFHELVELMIAPLEDCESSSTHRSTMASSSRFVSRPMWTTRCFRRVDTLSSRVQCALDNGAAGVILVQDPESLEMDGETRCEPSLHHSLPSTRQIDENRLTDKLVAMISNEEGIRLRASSHMSLCQKYMPLLSKEGSNYELLAQVSIEIRLGGTTYAWGNGQNGRLGVGPLASDVFEDGYEALTDTAYRFVDRPTPIVTLAGLEMTQLACGTTHSLAVTRQGKVFTWGRGSRGALAQVSSSRSSSRKKKRYKQSTRDVWIPRQVHGLRFENVVQVAANDACSLFLTEIVPPELYHERRREIAQLKAVAKKSLL